MPRTPVCPFRNVLAISAFLILAIAAPAQLRNRIAQNIGDTEPVMMSAPHPIARSEFDQGRVEGSLKIAHASIVFKLSAAQQADLDKLLAEQQNPQSANYRKWLTPEQYAARFGMSDADLAKVSAWLKSQGLTVDGYSRGRTQVFFSGNAAQVESAFRTQINRYLVDGEMHFANATEIYVPAALSSTVLGFRGFDDFHPRPRVHVEARPNFTSHVSGNHFISPGDFATIYNVQPLYDAGLDGTGVQIAVVGQSLIAANNATTDLDAFRAAAGLPKKDPTFVQVTGSTAPTIRSSGDQVESLLDLEWAGAVAKNADIIFVFTGPNLGAFDAINFAIDQNLAPVISDSYGLCESGFTAGNLASFRATILQANAQGQTLIGPSGDSGAADCESQTATVATTGLAVDVPASIPEVTGVGGSEFSGDTPTNTSGTTLTDAPADPPFWAGTSNSKDTISSALTYIPEIAWNDTVAGSAFSAGGGGVSTAFAKPTWQTPLTPADGQRDVPDIALNASPDHDPTLICAQGSCVTGFRDASQNLNVVGGTSVGAPTFAGIVALLNQAVPASTSAGGLGNINPTLYALAASTPTAFHDITTGNNKVACTSGTPTTGPAAARCPTAAPFLIGFSAGTGYDLVTGLGSIDANKLVTSWPGFVVAPGFSVGASAVTVTAPGQAGTSTVTLTATNGFSGDVALTCTPPTTTTTITCSFGATTPVTLNTTTTTGAATLTVTTTAPHVVTGTSVSLGPHGFGWLPAGGGALLAGILVVGVPSRRRRHLAGFGLMLLVLFTAGLGCGGGSSSSGGSTKTGGTAAGSYSVTVTATSGSLTRTATVAVTVQ
jgi:subtilase family serine protease